MSKTYYTNGIKTIKLDLDVDVIPEGFYPGAHWKGRRPWNKGLTKDDQRVKQYVEKSVKTRKENGYVAWNKGLTKDDDSRIKGLSGELNPMYGKHRDAWNKGLTKETDERMKKASDNHKGCTAWNKNKSISGHPHTQQTKQHLREIHLDTNFQKQRYDKMKQNGTLNVGCNSKTEQIVYEKLCIVYGKENVCRQYFDEQRYPFKCDFYIKNLDLFVEVQGNWTHGKYPYNPENKKCQEKLSIWKEKSIQSKFYKNAIYTWTDLDVRKRNTALQNNLNFIEVFDVDKFLIKELRELLETPSKEGQSAAKQIIII